MTKIGIELMEGVTAFFAGDFATSIRLLQRIMPHLQANIQVKSSSLIGPDPSKYSARIG